MIYLKNGRMLFPSISIAIPNNIYINTTPPTFSENGIEFISLNPHFKLIISEFDEKITKTVKDIGEDTIFSKYENININGISGLFLKYNSSNRNCAELLLDIEQKNCFDLLFLTENNVDDILNQNDITSLIKSIEIINNN